MKLSDLKVGMVILSHVNTEYTLEGIGKDWVVSKHNVNGNKFYTYCPEGVLRWGIKEIKPKIKRWINIYPDTYKNLTVGAFDTRQLADRASLSRRIACIEIEYTEGEGLPSVSEAKREGLDK